MGHAASPGLSSTGLFIERSEELSSFHWGIVVSLLAHILIILSAIFIRFQSEADLPLRAMEVSLVTLPVQEPADRPSTKPTPTPSPQPQAPPQAKTPPKSVPQPPKPPAKPREESLPPLPTTKSSERLSTSIGGAVGSITVPSRIEPSSSPLPPPSSEEPTKPQASTPPLMEKLHLPAAPPEISRPSRLIPTQPLPIPKTSVPVPEPTEPAIEKESPVKSLQEDLQAEQPEPSPAPTTPILKPVPKPPTLSPSKPFSRREMTDTPQTTKELESLESSLKKSIPQVPTRIPPSRSLKKTAPTPKTQQQTTSKTPKVTPAPALAPMPSTSPKASNPSPQREKLSDSMKQLLAGVKAPSLQSSLPHEETKDRQPGPPTISAPTPSSDIKSDIDQQLARLTIPEVAPVESIHKRLQLMRVQSSSGSDNAPTQPSPGENRYLALVKEEIDKRWIAPPVLDHNPSVIVTFHIDKSGEISKVRIEQGSGNMYYDQAILRAIHQANPLPKFPPELRESFLDIKFRFTKIEK